MAVSKRLRYEVLRRDNHTCRYCYATDTPLTVDHVIPVALGGSDDPGNLVAACKDCNAGKSASNPEAPLVADVAQDALRWSRAMQQVTDRHLADLRALNAYQQAVYEMWGKQADVLPTDWMVSAERWYAGGLDLIEIRYAVDVAIASMHVRRYDMWKYACGVIYKRLRERQEAAQKVLSGPEASADEPQDEDELREQTSDRYLRSKWLVLAGQWPELARLEAQLVELCFAVWNETEFEAWDVWSGPVGYEEKFGPTAATLLHKAVDSTWLNETERRTASDYTARLLMQAFEAFNNPWVNVHAAIST